MPCLNPYKFVVLFSALGGFLFGYDTSVINAALFQMKDHFDFSLESWHAGLIVSIAIAGAFVGSFAAGMGATAFGRRPAMAAADILFIAGSVLLAAAPTMWVLYIGRFIIGLGIGVASVMIPVYLAEITPAETRGSIITLNNVFLTGGQFVAAAIGGVLINVTSASLGWRLMFAIGALPALLQLVGLATLPESPRWLVLHGRIAEAEEVAARLGIDFSTLPVTDNSVGAVKPLGVSTIANFRLIFGKQLRRRLFVGAGLQLFQQLSGINTIMYYSSTILKKAGFSGDEDPVLLSIPLAFTNGLFTVAGIFIIERWGRRPLLIRSLIGCCAATIGMTVVGFLLDAEKASQEACGWSFMGLLIMYLAFFAPGMGAVPWVVNAEIYPNALRSDAASIATMVNWASNALVSQLFPILLGAAGTGPTFAVIAGLVVLAIGFVVRWVPETKEVPLEQIGSIFGEKEERDPLVERTVNP